MVFSMISSQSSGLTWVYMTSIGDDVHKRADLAEAVAAGFLKMDGVVGVLRKTDGNRQALFLAQPVQRLIYCHGTAGDASRCRRIP